MSELRNLPSVDRLLQDETVESLIDHFGRQMTVQALRSVLDGFRQSYVSGGALPVDEVFVMNAERLLQSWFAPTLQPVINATGVILHTNLGRSPLSQESIKAVQMVMNHYSTLEFNLKTGKRGSRLIHAEEILTRLTGAEAALVVNNNASAVLLALTTLARRRRVVISRTQLVEIGGGFRIPDVMKQSGARLVEVGTTNRVHLADYEQALMEPAAMIFRAHHSNFKIIGFTSEPELTELVHLAQLRGLLIMDDLGSGALLDTSQYGLVREPLVQDSVSAGVDITCFSGDKLLGGPQAGILVGKKEILERIKKHPLARAVRADKMCLAALSATLMHYLKGEAEQKIPIWRMISASTEEIRKRANAWQERLGFGEVIPGKSTVGGGSLPEETLETFVLRIPMTHADRYLAHLRKKDPPVIARIEGDSILFDPRTIFPEDDSILLGAMGEVLSEHQKEHS